MSQNTIVVALVEPRAGTERLSVALQLCQLLQDTMHQEPILIDMDPQCQLSMRLLKPDQLEICADVRGTSGAWIRDFLRAQPPPSPRALVWWSETEQVSFIPGWGDVEKSFMEILHFTAHNGFAPNPVEYLSEWLSQLRQDIAVLYLPNGWAPMVRMGVAAADSTLVFLHADVLGEAEVYRIQKRFAQMKHRASVMADLDTLHLLWSALGEGLLLPHRIGLVLPDDSRARADTLAQLIKQLL